MANKIGITLALDGEKEFAEGMKRAQQNSRNLDDALKDLADQYKESANSVDYLTQKNELLERKQQSLRQAAENARQAESKVMDAYKEQAKAVEQYKKSLEDAEKALQQIDKAADPKGFERQSKAVESAQKNYSSAQTALARYDTKLSKWEGNVSQAERALDRCNKEVDQNEKYMHEASSSADGCAKSIDKFGNEAKDAASDIGKAGDASKEMSISLGSLVKGKLIDMAGNLLQDLGQKAVEGFKKVVEVGSEFEAGMSKVQAISGASGAELQALSDKAKELGSTTAFTASEVADAMGEMAKAGWNAQDIVDGMDGVVSASLASGESMSSVSTIIADAITGFKLAASDAAHVSDLLTQAANSGTIDINDLGESFKYVAPVAQSMGFSIDEVTTALAAMSTAGIKGSQAGTSLRTAMLNMSSPSKSVQTAMDKIGLTITNNDGTFKSMTQILAEMREKTDGLTQAEKTNVVQKIAGKEAASGLMAILNMSQDEYDQIAQSMENAGGAAEKTANVMKNNLKGAMTEFSSAAEGLGIAVYDKVKGPLTGLVELGTDAISGLTGIIEGGIEGPFGDVLDQIEGVRNEAESLIESSKTSLDGMFSDVSQYQSYEKIILDLNDIEEKNTAQKDLMKAAVERLSGVVPGLAEAFDNETGSLKLTNDELENMFAKNNRLIAQKALEEIQADAIEAYTKSTLAVTEATQARQQAEDDLRNALIESGTFTAEQLDQIEAYKNGMLESSDITQELIDRSAMYNSVINSGAGGYQKYAEAIAEATDKEKEAIQTQNEAKSNMDGITKAYDQTLNTLNSSLGGTASTADRLASLSKAHGDDMAHMFFKGSEGAKEYNSNIEETIHKQQEEAEAVEDAHIAFKDSQVSVIETMELVKKSIDETAESVDNLEKSYGNGDKAAEQYQLTSEQIAEYQAKAAEAAEEAARIQEAAAEAQQNALSTIQSSFQSTYDSIAGTAEINMYDKFDGGEDVTVEQMIANMQASNEAMQQMQDEQKAVIDKYGDELGPELISYLESMGTDAANTWHHMYETMSQDNAEELFQEMGEQFRTGLDKQDEIAEAGAKNVTAYKLVLGELGSTKVEWNGLQKSIDGLDITDDVRSRLEGAAQAAQEAGVEIPDNLAEGIADGSVTPEQAIEELTSATEGAYDGLQEIAKAAGIEVPSSIADGIDGSSESFATAVKNLAAYLTNSDVDWKGQMEQAGSEAGQGFAAGAENTSGESQNAGSKLGEQAKAGFASWENAFYNVAVVMGQNAAEGITSESDAITGAITSDMSAAVSEATTKAADGDASGAALATAVAGGITSGSGTVTGAAGTVASRGAAAVRSYSGAFQTAGYYLSAGIASGIRNGQSAAVNAAAEVVARAVAAARAAGGINSPSKVMAEAVGQWLPKGVAFGMQKYTPSATGAATEMVKNIIEAAQKEAQKETQKADGIIDTTKGDASLLSHGAFEVSKTKTTGSGRKKKTTNKTDEEYDKDVLEAAKKYFDHQEILYDLSDEATEKYWTNVRKQMKSGTDAWYEATKKIKDAREKRKEEEKKRKEEEKKTAGDKGYNSANELLDEIQDYTDLTTKGVVQYWKNVKTALEKSGKKGTAEWIKADKELIEARKKQTEKQAELDDTRKERDSEAKEAWQEYYQNRTEILKDETDKQLEIEKDYEDKRKQILEDAQKEVEDILKQEQNAIDSRTEQIAGAYDLFDAFESKSATGEELLFNLQSQAEGYKFWSEQLEILKSRGIFSEDLMDELTSKGPQSAASIYALNQLSDEDLQAYQEAFTEKMDAAREQATKDVDKQIKALEEQRKAVEESRDKKLDELEADRQEQLDNLKAETETKLKEATDARNKKLDEISTKYNSKIDQLKADLTTGLSSGLAALSRNVNKFTSDAAQFIANSVMDAKGSGEVNKLHGYASGTPYYTGSAAAAWTQEHGSEIIVRKSDGAILTPMNQGDAVIPADLTKNLYEWGSFNPNEFLATAALNASLLTASRQSGGDAAILQQMYGLMSQIVSLVREGKEIRLDGDALVGATADKMSEELAWRSRRA